MKLGYARVSTTDQELAIQRTHLHEAGCEKLFEEKISGARKKRPVLERLLSELRAEDVVVVTRLDRLARSTSELLRIAETIEEKTLDFNPLRSSGPIRRRRSGAWCSPCSEASRSSNAR